MGAHYIQLFNWEGGIDDRVTRIDDQEDGIDDRETRIDD